MSTPFLSYFINPTIIGFYNYLQGLKITLYILRLDYDLAFLLKATVWPSIQIVVCCWNIWIYSLYQGFELEDGPCTMYNQRCRKAHQTHGALTHAS